MRSNRTVDSDTLRQGAAQCHWKSCTVRPLAATCRSPSRYGTAMALTELENARANKTLGEFIDRRRPAPHVRHELDLGYRVPGQSVEVYEVRPAWDRPGERWRDPLRKPLSFELRTCGGFTWQRADLKWHLYEPASEVPGLREFVSVLEDDPHGCSWE